MGRACAAMWELPMQHGAASGSGSGIAAECKACDLAMCQWAVAPGKHPETRNHPLKRCDCQAALWDWAIFERNVFGTYSESKGPDGLAAGPAAAAHRDSAFKFRHVACRLGPGLGRPAASLQLGPEVVGTGRAVGPVGPYYGRPLIGRHVHSQARHPSRWRVQTGHHGDLSFLNCGFPTT